jgi:galactose mutarotase-like enzyme
MTLASPRNHGCRISDGWTYKGMRTLVLENELLRVTVLVDKGSDIVEFRYKPRDLDFLLFMPGGIRNPQHGVPSAFTNSPFIDYYSGGWNEILPSGGPAVTYQGASFGQHGEISLIPWDYAILEDAPERVMARLWVRPIRTPFFVEKTLMLEPGRAVLHIESRVVNEGGQPLHLMWGQHIAFGRPFLEEETVIDVPARRLLVHEASPDFGPRRFQPGSNNAWPHVTAPDGSPLDASRVPAYGALQALEMAYLTELTDGWYAITNPHRRVGFGLRFDASLYRYIWLWQNLGNVAQGFPWWGRTHTTALEPWTSYPTSGLPDAIANNTALLLQPGEDRRTSLRAVAYEGLERVGRVTESGDVKPVEA